MKKTLLFTLLLSVTCSLLQAQQEIKLYPNGPKESNGITEKEVWDRPDFLTKISEPRMYYYAAPADKANGTAVLICPGGGYRGVSVVNEGENVAKWFNEQGVTAFVLYYRMPNEHTTVPLTDAQTALELIHKRAKEWKIAKDKIGVMGFSAGGHLASTVGTHFTNKNNRPAFMILGYPVVTMKALTHGGSHNNLLGNKPTPELEDLYSNELQVKKNTPPTFIFHATDDKAVPVQNSVQLYKALLVKNIVAELDTFAVGGHGFGMKKRGIPADNWPELLKKWMITQKLIAR